VFISASYFVKSAVTFVAVFSYLQLKCGSFAKTSMNFALFAHLASLQDIELVERPISKTLDIV